MGLDAMILVFWMLSFKPAFSLSSFSFMKSLFSPLHFMPEGWFHLRIWGYWFLLAILIPACASSSPAFLMMYSAYKLNKQGNNIQPWCTPFPIWSQSVVPCPVLTVASWPACKAFVQQSFTKVKRDTESFWHRHQKGDGECPPASVSKGVTYFYN